MSKIEQLIPDSGFDGYDSNHIINSASYNLPLLRIKVCQRKIVEALVWHAKLTLERDSGKCSDGRLAVLKSGIDRAGIRKQVAYDRIGELLGQFIIFEGFAEALAITKIMALDELELYLAAFDLKVFVGSNGG